MKNEIFMKTLDGCEVRVERKLKAAREREGRSRKDERDTDDEE